MLKSKEMVADPALVGGPGLVANPSNDDREVGHIKGLGVGGEILNFELSDQLVQAEMWTVPVNRLPELAHLGGDPKDRYNGP